MSNVKKASSSMVINTKLVAKAVKLVVSAHENWEDAKYETVKMLAEMNENERADWFDQVKERYSVGLNLFRRMAAVAARG